MNDLKYWMTLCEAKPGVLAAMPPSWVQKLIAAGYRRIGHGRHSQVWAKDGDAYVVKIFRDDAYREFIELIGRHRNNPHFPKIKGQLVHLGEYWAIRIERLTRLAPAKMVSTIAQYRSAYNAIRLPQGDVSPNWLTYMTKFSDDFKSSHPELADALDLIFSELCDTQQCFMDLSEDNYRMRGQTVVLNDPVAASSKRFFGNN